MTFREFFGCTPEVEELSPGHTFGTALFFLIAIFTVAMICTPLGVVIGRLFAR